MSSHARTGEEASVYPLDRSLQMKESAASLIPSCTQTFSKGPTQFVQGAAPVFAERAQGCYVWDVDGNRYVDYSMGLGSVVLGHAHPAVTEACTRQLQQGTSLSLPHRLEARVAQMMTESIPCAEMVRFGKNGSDVTSGAVRAARAITGRDVVLCCGYHGWQDWFIGTTTRASGVPRPVRDLTLTFPYADVAALETLLSQNTGAVAAVIIEPLMSRQLDAGYFAEVAELTRSHGALFILDEVITGFRVGLGGAQALLGVVPDLACFGKALGNGLPISAVVGPAERMDIFDEIFFSFTFGGELLGLVAAEAVLRFMSEHPVVEHLEQLGSALMDGYNDLVRELGLEQETQAVGLPGRHVLEFRGPEPLLTKSYLQQECVKRGVLFVGFHNLSYSHGASEIDQTLTVYEQALSLLKDALSDGSLERRLTGEPIKPVFRDL